MAMAFSGLFYYRAHDCIQQLQDSVATCVYGNPFVYLSAFASWAGKRFLFSIALTELSTCPEKHRWLTVHKRPCCQILACMLTILATMWHASWAMVIFCREVIHVLLCPWANPWCHVRSMIISRSCQCYSAATLYFQDLFFSSNKRKVFERCRKLGNIDLLTIF